MGWQQLRGPLPCSPSLPLTMILRPVFRALLSSASSSSSSSFPHGHAPPPPQRHTTSLSRGFCCYCRHRSKYASFSSLHRCFKYEDSSSVETRSRGFRVLAHAQEKGRKSSTVWDDAADSFFDNQGKVAPSAVAEQEGESIQSLGISSGSSDVGERRNGGFQAKSNRGSDALGATNPRGESHSEWGKERNAGASSGSSWEREGRGADGRRSWDGSHGGVDENFRAGRQHGGREMKANIAPARGGRGGEWDDIAISGSKGNVGSSTRGKLHRGGHIGSGSKNDQEYASREWKLASSSSSKAGVKGREWERAGLNQFGRAEEQTTSTRNWGAAEGWKKSAGKFSNQSQGNHHRRSMDGYRSDRRGGYGGGAKIQSLEENDDGGEDEEEWVIQSGREWGREHEANVNWRLEGEPVYGVAPIRAALVASRREFYTLYMQENLTENIETGKRKDKQALVWILNRMKELGVRLKVVSKHDLNLLVDNRPHQGLVLDASPLELVPIEKLDKVSNDGVEAPVWVALDEVVDPQNFGAILRSAYFLGATGVVVCAKNSAPLSGVVSKASAGALEVMEVQSCRNMVKFLDMSVQNGWRAVGASFESQAHAVRDLAPGLPTILVLGNEGRGLRTNVRRVCSDLVCIVGVASKRPLQDFSQRQSPSKELKMVDVDGIAAEEPVKFVGYPAGPAAVDSLNVSVAAGILLHELLAQSVYPTSLSSMETISHDTSIKEASSNCG